MEDYLTLERAMLNDAVGSIEQIDGIERIVTGIDRVGHALYGPYISLGPGRYSVSFDISVAQDCNASGDDICAVVDITSNVGNRDIAFDRIVLSQLRDRCRFVLEFDTAEPLDDCEFRLWTTGIVGLLISDRPALTSRDGDEPAVGGSWNLGLLDRSLVKKLWLSGIKLDIRSNEIAVATDHFDAFKSQILTTERDRLKLAEFVVEGVGYRGCGENSLYRAFVGTDRPLHSPPQPVPLTSALCNQVHFGYDQYRFWSHALKEEPKYQRKR